MFKSNQSGGKKKKSNQSVFWSAYTCVFCLFIPFFSSLLLEVVKNTNFSLYAYGPTPSYLFVQMTIQTQ